MRKQLFFGQYNKLPSNIRLLNNTNVSGSTKPRAHDSSLQDKKNTSFHNFVDNSPRQKTTFSQCTISLWLQKLLSRNLGDAYIQIIASFLLPPSAFRMRTNFFLREFPSCCFSPNTITKKLQTRLNNAEAILAKTWKLIAEA